MMNSIKELEIWLEKNCYSFGALSIGKHFAPEGIIIEEDNGRFNWCYSERGHKTIVASFDNEKGLVDYAFNRLSSDKWLKAHIVAFTFNETKIKELSALLENMNIEYVRNDITNYSNGNSAYRIFVFGCDIKKVEHFKMEYMYR